MGGSAYTPDGCVVEPLRPAHRKVLEGVLDRDIPFWFAFNTPTDAWEFERLIPQLQAHVDKMRYGAGTYGRNAGAMQTENGHGFWRARRQKARDDEDEGVLAASAVWMMRKGLVVHLRHGTLNSERLAWLSIGRDKPLLDLNFSKARGAYVASRPDADRELHTVLRAGETRLEGDLPYSFAWPVDPCEPAFLDLLMEACI